MFNIKTKVIFMALLIPLFLNANYIFNKEVLNQEVSKYIEDIGDELNQKTGVSAYILVTGEAFGVGFNLVKYAKQHEATMKKPYVLFIFAPNAKITEKTKMTGRVGIIPSSKEVRALYDYDDVRDAILGVIAVKDKNSFESKANIGLLQAYSELADNIAQAKGIDLKKTIKDDTKYVISAIRILLSIGLLILIWIYWIRPFVMRRKNGE
jgi:hypothetical protein